MDGRVTSDTRTTMDTWQVARLHPQPLSNERPTTRRGRFTARPFCFSRHPVMLYSLCEADTATCTSGYASRDATPREIMLL